MDRAELPEIPKTALMALVEARDSQHRDVRLVVREMYLRSRQVETVAADIAALTGQSCTKGTVSTWFKEWGWSIERTLLTPGLPEVPSDEQEPLIVATAA